MRRKPSFSISGPPCSGKTTLAADLVQRFGERAAFVEDIPRTALELLLHQGIQLNQAEFQHYVGIAQLVAEEALAGRSFPSVVSLLDKSVVDAIAYWDVLVGGDRPEWCNVLSRERYTAVFICEHGDVLAAPEGLAMVHYSLRARLAQSMLEVAHGASLQVIRVAGDPSRRAAFVQGIVETHLAQSR